MAFKETASHLRRNKIAQYQASGFNRDSITAKQHVAAGQRELQYPVSAIIGSCWLGWTLDTLGRSIPSALDGFT